MTSKPPLKSPVPSGIESAIAEACDAVGSQAALARLLGVGPVMVWQWCRGKRPIPAHHAVEIERHTRAAGKVVLCERLHPPVDWAFIRREAA
jgi:DNA-binding transcriptional regulator YdaS (Cro superfamily)